MSEVYIRSQNKEKLYRLGGNYACVEYGEYEDIKKKRGGAEADKKRHVICISDGCLEEIGEYGEADSDSKGIYRHAGEFRPPAHYRGQSRGLRRVSGSVQTVCRP